MFCCSGDDVYPIPRLSGVCLIDVEKDAEGGDGFEEVTLWMDADLGIYPRLLSNVSLNGEVPSFIADPRAISGWEFENDPEFILGSYFRQLIFVVGKKAYGRDIRFNSL
jgi:hypothetical protein